MMTTPTQDDHGATESRIPRRHALLGAAAVGGATLAALASKPAAAAEPTSSPGTPQITLAELRALNGDQDPEQLYLLTDPGMAGLFRLDPDDQTTPDNTGGVVVTAAGQRYLRVYDSPNGRVNVQWFGAKGDQVTDDTAALQAAIDEAQRVPLGPNAGRTVYLPPGRYPISSTLVIRGDRPIALVGDGNMTSDIRMNQGTDDRVEAMIRLDGDARAFTFADFRAVGYERADYIIDAGPLLRKTYFRAVGLNGARKAGLKIARGWYNSATDCNFMSGAGDGVLIGPSQVNELTFVNCLFSANDNGIAEGIVGHGLHIIGGGGNNWKQQIAVIGGSIEGNAGTGIQVDGEVKALKIDGVYFESNHKAYDETYAPYPHIYISPEYESGPVMIRGCYMLLNNPSGYPGVDSTMVQCDHVGGGLSITNNALRTGPHKVTLVQTATDASESGKGIDNLHLAGNYIYARDESGELVEVAVDGLGAGTTTLHTATIEGTPRANYSPGFDDYAPPVRSARRGNFQATERRYRTAGVWELTSGGDSGEWGFTIDLDDSPELAGRYIYFACYARASSTSAGLVLSTSQLGGHTEQPAGTEEWQLISLVDKMPDSGSVRFGVAMITDGAATVEIARPVLSELGVRYSDYEAR